MKIEDIDKTWDLFSKHDAAKQMLERVKEIKDITGIMAFIDRNRFDVKIPELDDLKRSTIILIDKQIREIEDKIKAI